MAKNRANVVEATVMEEPLEKTQIYEPEPVTVETPPVQKRRNIDQV